MSNRINDIIEPTVFAAYVREKVSELSALVKSGAVKNSDALVKLASGGGRIVNMPFWNRVSGDSEVLSQFDALNPTPVTAENDKAAIHYRGKAWSARELGSAIAGDSAVSAVADMVAEYWVREEQKLLVASLTGAFSSPGMEDHVYGASNPRPISA
ncbi:MAG: coat protein, partial [Defluviitaleaceae bacterium]|nr:coat protein [Defluviitaleaceae bacterium]